MTRIGYLRISDQLKLVGIGVSPSTVWAVWQRVGLTKRIRRLLWLELFRHGLLDEV